jgi:hypothetical protein
VTVPSDIAGAHPNVDALAERIEDALNSLYGDTDVVFDSRPAYDDGRAAVSALAEVNKRLTRRVEELAEALHGLVAKNPGAPYGSWTALWWQKATEDARAVLDASTGPEGTTE